MKKLTLALLLAAASPAVVLAQPSTAAQAPSASHLAAALEMLEAMNTGETLTRSVDVMLRMQIEQNPQLRQVEGVMRDFFNRYMSWDQMKDDYARLYAEAFTEAELRELSGFYRTPLGRKVATTTPQLAARGAELGEKTVQEHMPELVQALTEKLQGSGGGTTP